jgi:hypothetical protein
MATFHSYFKMFLAILLIIFVMDENKTLYILRWHTVKNKYYTEYPTNLEPQAIYASLLQLCVMALSKDDHVEVILLFGGYSQWEVAVSFSTHHSEWLPIIHTCVGKLVCSLEGLNNWTNLLPKHNYRRELSWYFDKQSFSKHSQWAE